jgi:hypothetical protein
MRSGNMTRIGRVRFRGKSGARYAFTVHPLDTVFEEGFSGVYVVTERKPGNSKSGFVHRRIAIGQSVDLCHPLAEDVPSFTEQGANCICLYRQANPGARHNVQKDLFREP